MKLTDIELIIMESQPLLTVSEVIEVRNLTVNAKKILFGQI